MQISDANLTTAYGNFIPSLSASASMGRSGSTTTTVVGDIINANGSVSAGLSANVTLFDGFRNTSSLNRATSAADAAAFNFAKQKQSTVLAVEQSYLTVLRNQQLLTVSQENLKRSQQQLSRIEESNKVGALAKSDVYRQQVQTATDELALINAQSNYDNSKQDMLYLLALDVTMDYNFEDPSVLQQIAGLISDSLHQEYADYNKLVQEALESRPDYQSSLLARKISENDLSISRSGHYPSLSLGTGYSLGGQNFGTMSDSKSWNWRLSMSIPIFSGFQTSTAVQTSQLNLELAEQQLEQAKRSVAKDVKYALLSLETARKRYDVSLKNMKSAEEDRRIAEERYNLGSNTLLDLLVATANYTQAISNKVSSSYDFVYAKLQFRIAVGREKY
jgi:outer membrane protein